MLNESAFVPAHNAMRVPSGQQIYRNQVQHNADIDKALAARKAFSDFVGNSFYGQMIKSMRSTVGKAAYFDGGRAEEIFRAQLDQQLAKLMAESPNGQLVQPMFERQFPKLSSLLREHENQQSNELAQLDQLRRS